ncbi:radical SAM/SPASM domain-containing protein [Geomesophilobacter sediminis]|uniref:Radical SAM protein n=1 Tax=Geomesophilobacter sediminis TaxID=2798584 RepID=A0A8J7M1Q9_9BACT|nr:radical SAM/SPASM domain-containing protein [Geomesophilobacter sediminis]MBJ6726828.1 radical SAM protein [Geomesophilobacter sediminis]
MRFLRSFKDIRHFYEKIRFLWPRLTGTIVRWTDTPPCIQIEPTAFCNINCLTCGRSDSTRTPGNMDFDLFKKIIDDAADLGIKRILLFLHGEPLLHPRIVEMIRYLKSKDMGFHLTTNGTLLDRAMARTILECGVSSSDYVTFSILGFSKEVHEKVMRGVNHEAVVQNVHDFLELRKASGVNGPVIETVYYASKENRHERDQFLKYWRGVADHAIDGGSVAEAFVSGGLPQVPRTRTCTQLWERMIVLWNGDVGLCPQDLNGDYLMGNLKEQSIREVWTGDALSRIKRSHYDKNFDAVEICRFCDW